MDNEYTRMKQAESTKNAMRENGQYLFYLLDNQDKTCLYNERFSIVNYNNSVVFNNIWVKKGKHNFAGTRYDAWFVFEGYWWHGVNYGENSQLIHCKKTKHPYNETAWMYR
jgi:hypothetical protein